MCRCVFFYTYYWHFYFGVHLIRNNFDNKTQRPFRHIQMKLKCHSINRFLWVFMTFLFRWRIKFSTNLDSNTLEVRNLTVWSVQQISKSSFPNLSVYFRFHFEEIIEALHSWGVLKLEIRFDIISSRLKEVCKIHT